MKQKSLLTAFALLIMLTSSEAFASRARLMTIGTGDGGLLFEGQSGSLSANDNYNIFYNPALVNTYSNWAVIEKSNSNGTGTNRAQGGIFGTLLSFNSGLYMNRVQPLTAGSYAYANGANMQPLEVFFGGDMGVRWGLGLSYATYKSEVIPNNSKVDSDMNVSAGVQVGDLEIFARGKVIGKEESAGEGNTYKDYLLGSRLQFGEWTPYIAGRHQKKNGLKAYTFGGGFSRNTRLSEGISLGGSLSFWRKMVSYSANRSHLPLDISIEAEALSWLTVRGLLTSNLYARNYGNSVADATTGRLGATFKFSKVKLDWVIGGSVASENIDAPTIDVSNGLMTAFSLAYQW